MAGWNAITHGADKAVVKQKARPATGRSIYTGR